MSELYGAPSGITAYNKSVEDSALAGMHLLKLLGDIEQQPAEKRLKEAHARLFESEADLKASQMRDLQTLQQVDAGIYQARAAGVDATVADLPKLTTPPAKQSIAAPVTRYIAAARAKGVPERLLIPYVKEEADLLAKESTMASQEAMRDEHKATAALKKAERAGSLATMGLRGPEAYSQMLLIAADNGMPVDHLPPTYGPAAIAALENIRDSSVGVKDQMAQQLRAKKEAAQEKRWTALSAKDAAIAAHAAALTAQAEFDYKQAKKNGGKYGPEATEQRKVLRQRREQMIEAQNRKDFPPAPLDPSARKPEQAYTAADGKTRFLWTKDPATGKFAAMVLPSKNTGKISATDNTAGEADDEEED